MNQFVDFSLLTDCLTAILSVTHWVSEYDSSLWLLSIQATEFYQTRTGQEDQQTSHTYCRTSEYQY